MFTIGIIPMTITSLLYRFVTFPNSLSLLNANFVPLMTMNWTSLTIYRQFKGCYAQLNVSLECPTSLISNVYQRNNKKGKLFTGNIISGYSG